MYDQNLHLATYVALEGEGNDHLGGGGLFLKGGGVKSPILGGDDCQFREGRDATNHTNFCQVARLAYGYVQNRSPGRHYLLDSLRMMTC